jgi:integrase
LITRAELFADLELAHRLIQNATTDDLRFVLFCGFHTGMRKLEIVDAVPEWFNLSTRTVEIRATSTFRPKDRDARTVSLTDQFARLPEKLRPAIALRVASRNRARKAPLPLRFPP